MDIGDVINGWRIVEDAGAGRSGHVFIVYREGDPSKYVGERYEFERCPHCGAFMENG